MAKGQGRYVKIWIDLTDFLQWSGNLTGIQRVQYNLSKKFIESGRRVGFFIYDESNRIFKEVSFNPDEIVKSGIVAADSRLQKTSETAIRKIIRRVKPHKASQQHVKGVGSPFKRGDMVAVLGGIWVGTFIDDLISCKEKHELKFVHFAFDMIPTLFPGYVVEWLPRAFGDYQVKVFTHVDGIIAISESTANDVRSFIQKYDIKNNPKIVVTRIGEEVNTGEVDESDVLPIKQLIDKPYILSVSTIEGRKNHAALFYAVKEASRRGVQLPKVVIVGRNGWLTDDIRFTIINDLEAREKILILNDINDRELLWLYKNCLFTIFPSFYEGWGMPIAESLAYGKLCISSNTSSMPEIAGDLIDYFSPYDTGELLERIIENLDEDVRQDKEKIIASHYKQTSWDTMFKQIDQFVSKISS
ncbi:MAG: glycosyltransferase family 4 protein [Candidatus Saccharimonas sp.]|nr:glycosyltransferase family 4 protein [Candidatus Saccharimonas sp.]